MILSIGELIDKLVIENIKAYNVRQELSEVIAGQKFYEKVSRGMKIRELYSKLMTYNTNRNILIKTIDEKTAEILDGKPNKVMKTVRSI